MLMRIKTRKISKNQASAEKHLFNYEKFLTIPVTGTDSHNVFYVIGEWQRWRN
jgi:hypothetical protein